MRALHLDGKLAYLPDCTDPNPRAGESLVRVRLAGICGTDLELARGYMAFRGIPGHEFIGQVERSSNADLIGRRIAGEINAACGACDFCTSGFSRHCPSRSVLGIVGRDGAFADFLCLPDRNLIAVPDSIADEAAVFIEPIAAAYEIFEQTELVHSDRICVLGDGRLGALIAMVLAGEGYAPVLGGHHDDKLAYLARLGFDTHRERDLASGFSVVIDCTGSSAGFNRAVELVRPRGRLILKSTAASAANLNLAPIVVNEVTVIGSRCGRFPPAVDALAAGRIDPRPLISGSFPIARGLEAFAAAAQPSNFKILLDLR